MNNSPESHASSSSIPSVSDSNSSTKEEPDLMDVMFDKVPKSVDLKISCSICGDRASGFHYGVHACEGCKGFFRRTVRMRLKYKECEVGCKISVKSRNKCQYCRFQKCLKNGMSHDAIRFGRMSRVEKNRIIAKMAAEEPQEVSRQKLEEIEKLKKLTETIYSAFQEHFSMTRAKILAKWKERSLPGSSAKTLNTMADIRTTYPQFFQNNIKTEPRSTENSPPPVRMQMEDQGSGYSTMMDEFLSSPSSVSDSGSDELLSTVKKATFPYPHYQDMSVTPTFPHVPQMGELAQLGLNFGGNSFPDDIQVAEYLSNQSSSAHSSPVMDYPHVPYDAPISTMYQANPGYSQANTPHCPLPPHTNSVSPTPAMYGSQMGSSHMGHFGGNMEVMGLARDQLGSLGSHVGPSGGQMGHLGGQAMSFGGQVKPGMPSEEDVKSLIDEEMISIFKDAREKDDMGEADEEGENTSSAASDFQELLEKYPNFHKIFDRLGIKLGDIIEASEGKPGSAMHHVVSAVRHLALKRYLVSNLPPENRKAAGLQKMNPLLALEPEKRTKQLASMKIVKFLYQNMQRRLVKGVCELTEFSKNIPSFVDLPLGDQVILLKYGSYEALFVMLGAMIFDKGMLLPEGNIYVTFDFVDNLGEVGNLMKPKFQFAEKIAGFNLEDKELSLFAASIILFGDRPGLTEKEKVEEIQSEILRALQLQLKISHPNDSQLFAKLLLKMTDLRQLAADHVTMIEKVVKRNSLKKGFHPLLSEIIKDRD